MNQTAEYSLTKRLSDSWETTSVREVITGLGNLGEPGLILCMHSANERRRYTVTPSLIGWAHTQNNPSQCCHDANFIVTGNIEDSRYTNLRCRQ